MRKQGTLPAMYTSMMNADARARATSAGILARLAVAAGSARESREAHGANTEVHPVRHSDAHFFRLRNQGCRSKPARKFVPMLP